MTKKTSAGSFGRSFNGMLPMQKRVIFMVILTFCTVIIHAASLPMITNPLKPSPDTGPYQDDEFLAVANDTIYGLSNQSIPNGTALRELQTTQQQLAQMNISPDLYPTARQIYAYIYYTARAGDEFSNIVDLTSSPYSPIAPDDSSISGAKQMQIAAKTIWSQIQDIYPGVIPYRIAFPDPPSPLIEDEMFNRTYNPFLSSANEDEEVSGFFGK